MTNNCEQVPIVRKTTGREYFQRELEDLSPGWGITGNFETFLIETACTVFKGSYNNCFTPSQCCATAMENPGFFLSKSVTTQH